MLTIDHLLVMEMISRMDSFLTFLWFEMRIRGLLFLESLILNKKDYFLLSPSSQESLLGICQVQGTCVCVLVVQVLPDLINLH